MPGLPSHFDTTELDQLRRRFIAAYSNTFQNDNTSPAEAFQQLFDYSSTLNQLSTLSNYTEKLSDLESQLGTPSSVSSLAPTTHRSLPHIFSTEFDPFFQSPLSSLTVTPRTSCSSSPSPLLQITNQPSTGTGISTPTIPIPAKGHATVPQFSAEQP